MHMHAKVFSIQIIPMFRLNCVEGLHVTGLVIFIYCVLIPQVLDITHLSYACSSKYSMTINVRVLLKQS